MTASLDHEERRSGLLEKLVIVAIVLVLAAITTVMMSRLEKQFAKKDRAREDCKAWANAAERFKAVYGDYPPNLETLALPQYDGSPPFMEAKSLYDPWGHEYMYQYPGQRNEATGKPDVYSWGPRMHDPDSIIGNWE
jgi:hypothetical protein